MAIGDVLSKLAEWLGLKPSEARQLEKQKEQLTGSRAENVERIEGLKEQIEALEARAQREKREYSRLKGARQRIVVGQMERTFRELDRLRGKEKIIANNIEVLSRAIEKIEELDAARVAGVSDDQLDALAIDLEGSLDELARRDKATADLEKVTYETEDAEAMDIEARFAEMEGAAPASEGAAEADSGELPAHLRERFRDLGDEPEPEPRPARPSKKPQKAEAARRAAERDSEGGDEGEQEAEAEEAEPEPEGPGGGPATGVKEEDSGEAPPTATAAPAATDPGRPSRDVDADAQECVRCILREAAPTTYLQSAHPSRLAAWKRAAAEGRPTGQYLAGRCIEAGFGSEPNPQEAVGLFRSAAEQDYPPAQAWLGACYQEGLGLEPDPAQAITWYRKGADHGYAEAQFYVGTSYAEGVGVEPDTVEAATWYRKAAEQGAAVAQFTLGMCYLLGEGVPQDIQEAEKWLQMAADQGFPPGRAARGVPMGVPMEGIADAWATATQRLRDFVERHLSVFERITRAREERAEERARDAAALQRDADAGNAEAQWELSRCYRSGRGVAQDTAEAAKWCRRAANEGHAAAQLELARCYLNGRGVALDTAEGVRWARKAAEQGDAQAQILLGVCYTRGLGVERDFDEAEQWLQKAVAQDASLAKAALWAVQCRRRTGCFITTAVAETLGLGDDCRELNALRRFRDTYMLETPQRRAEVAHYYRVAPLIVERIWASASPGEVWRELAHSYVLPAVRLVEAGQAEASRQLYRRMVRELSGHWLAPHERAAAPRRHPSDHGSGGGSRRLEASRTFAGTANCHGSLRAAAATRALRGATSSE